MGNENIYPLLQRKAPLKYLCITLGIVHSFPHIPPEISSNFQDGLIPIGHGSSEQRPSVSNPRDAQRFKKSMQPPLFIVSLGS